ncbi:MAG: choice-of-anchor Q domain-containing protein, partial [Betaproteobacteria bacterium]
SVGGNLCSTSAASLTMANTIAANNTGANDVATNAINGGGNASDGVGNLITTNTGFAGTVVSTADPLLVALIPGGGIESVMVPAVGSPAIDAGACDATTIDQRGDTRPWQQTPCDIGAVETNDVIFRNGFE